MFGFRVCGFRVLGLWGLGFRVFLGAVGFRGLSGLRVDSVLGFRALGL